MTVDDALASPEANDRGSAPEPFSPEWWRSRSAEELRALLDRGFGSSAFEGATAEAERRAREELKAEDQAAESVASHKRSLRLGILEAVLLGCLLAIIAALLMR